MVCASALSLLNERFLLYKRYLLLLLLILLLRNGSVNEWPLYTFSGAVPAIGDDDGDFFLACENLGRLFDFFVCLFSRN